MSLPGKVAEITTLQYEPASPLIAVMAQAALLRWAVSSAAGEGAGMKRRRFCPPTSPQVGVLRWVPVPSVGDPARGPLVPAYGLSYRDLEELLAERGIEVDHVILYRWVQRFTPLIVEAARPRRHVAGDRWLFAETYV